MDILIKSEDIYNILSSSIAEDNGGDGTFNLSDAVDDDMFSSNEGGPRGERPKDQGNPGMKKRVGGPQGIPVDGSKKQSGGTAATGVAAQNTDQRKVAQQRRKAKQDRSTGRAGLWNEDDFKISSENFTYREASKEFVGRSSTAIHVVSIKPVSFKDARNDKFQMTLTATSEWKDKKNKKKKKVTTVMFPYKKWKEAKTSEKKMSILSDEIFPKIGEIIAKNKNKDKNKVLVGAP